jgi:hypothetical protein
MIEVTMRHDDRGRSRVGPKAFSGRALDQALGADQARINQHPAPVPGLAGPEKDDVHNS